MSTSHTLVVGVDAGGTSTRVLVAALDGTVLGRARGTGANPVTHGLDPALRTLRDTLAEALGGLGPDAADRVAGIVLGLAGDHLARQDGPARALAAMLHGLGLRCPHAVVGDAVVAFAAATPEPDGRLLISGTGSVAVLVRDRAIVDTAGGYGWLLGDGGSGAWLGREAVRAAVDTLRGRARAPRLTALVRDALLDADEPVTGGAAGAEQLLAALYAQSPLRLAEFAPLVLRAAAEGDPDVPPILDRAARHLDALLHRFGPHTPTEPLVLAGSCLAPDVLGRRTAELVLARGPARLLRAEDSAAGAAWLAAHRLPDGEPRRLAELHAALTGADR